MQLLAFPAPHLTLGLLDQHRQRLRIGANVVGQVAGEDAAVEGLSDGHGLYFGNSGAEAVPDVLAEDLKVAERHLHNTIA